MSKNTFAEQALGVLNAIDYSKNWWDDVVSRLPGFSQEKTEALDTACRSDVVGFVDGSVARLEKGEWIAD